MLDIPIFRKSIRTDYGYEISPDEHLTHATLLSLMKVIDLILGFLDPMHPYCLLTTPVTSSIRVDISDALQNMMHQNLNIDTSIKHYLPRRSADARAIVWGFEPQKYLMRAASRMTRWIDPDRPHFLTLEQSQSVDKHPQLRQLLAQRARWSQRYKGAATKQSGYICLSKES
ncbi:hypothetical protein BJ878DRAFT_178488 [Calycina marina]|uniref:Uncharacterized protein n=1 Tax=Calycina marina TaxID=1763456 RepID=A0A9P8CEH2_9HELO|nr:hypothetical protein BJ878DRAFT_178488 [Calycina marina]